MAWSCKAWIFCKQFLRFFFGKMTHYGKIFKILFWKFTALPIDVVGFKCREIFPTGNRWNSALFTSQKILAPSQTIATEQIAPKICQGQPPTFGSHCSIFHLNLFTFDRVIAKSMNTILLPVECFHDLPEAKHCFRRGNPICSCMYVCSMSESDTYPFLQTLFLFCMLQMVTWAIELMHFSATWSRSTAWSGNVDMVPLVPAERPYEGHQTYALLCLHSSWTL